MLIDSCEDPSVWYAVSCTPIIDAIDFVEGTGSLTVTDVDPLAGWHYLYRLWDPQDWTKYDGGIKIAFKAPLNAKGCTLQVVAPDWSNMLVYSMFDRRVEGEWVEATLDLANPDSIAGTPDIAQVTGIRLAMGHYGDPTLIWKWDNIRVEQLVPPPTHTVTVDSNLPDQSFKIIKEGIETSYAVPWTGTLEEGTYEFAVSAIVDYKGQSYRFVQWEDAVTGSVLSTNPTLALNVTSDISIRFIREPTPIPPIAIPVVAAVPAILILWLLLRK